MAGFQNWRGFATRWARMLVSLGDCPGVVDQQRHPHPHVLLAIRYSITVDGRLPISAYGRKRKRARVAPSRERCFLPVGPGLRPLLGTHRSMTTSVTGASTSLYPASPSWTNFTLASCRWTEIGGFVLLGQFCSTMSRCILRWTTPALGLN